VSGSLSGLLFAQVLYLAIGAGLLPLLGIAPTWDLWLRRFGLAYMVGVAVAGILAAHLALLDAPLGLFELTVLAVVLLVLGWRRLRRTPTPAPKRALNLPRPLAWANVALSVATALLLGALLGQATSAFAARPLKEWDGWAIWATKAKALYEFGGVHDPVFSSYEPVAHPILLPSLEAMGFRAMDAFDGTLIHVQLIALAFGFATALWWLLADRVPSAVLGVGLLALLSATPVLTQLSTNLADVPLAFFFALGVVSLGRFVLAGERWTLVAAALFLGAAMLTKSEGLLFAAAAFLAAAIVVAAGRDWRRLGHVAVSATAAFAILVPWRIYLAANDLRNSEYRLSDALDPAYLADRSERVGPAVSRLWDELWSAGWGVLPLVALVAVTAGALARRYRLAAFALLWPILAFGGLVLVYWISVVPVELTLTWTAERIVVSLVVGAAALAPLLVGEAFQLEREARTRDEHAG
jgi:Dolichyl-phosphate-mannose-protein mannosyltransferase